MALKYKHNPKCLISPLLSSSKLNHLAYDCTILKLFYIAKALIKLLIHSQIMQITFSNQADNLHFTT